MPATTPRGFHYWLPGDPPDIAASTQSLATDLDTYLTAVNKQYWAATLTNSPNTITADSAFHVLAGWAVVSQVGNFSYPGGGVFSYNGTVPRIMQVNAHVAFAATGSHAGQRVMQLRQNTGSVDEYGIDATTTSNTHLRTSFFGIVNPGDTFSVFLLITSGAGNAAPIADGSVGQFSIQTAG